MRYVDEKNGMLYSTSPMTSRSKIFFQVSWLALTSYAYYSESQESQATVCHSVSKQLINLSVFHYFFFILLIIPNQQFIIIPSHFLWIVTINMYNSDVTMSSMFERYNSSCPNMTDTKKRKNKASPIPRTSHKAEKTRI